MNSVVETVKGKYIGLSKVKKATIWITACSFLQRGLSFITVPIFTRLLSTSEYGSVSVYQSWEMVAMYIVTLGITYGGFNNGMIRFKSDREGYTTSVVGLVIVLGLLWLSLSVMFSNYTVAISGMPLNLVSLLFIEVIVKGIYDIWVSRMKYDFEYGKLVSASLLLSLFVPISGVLFVITASDKVLARILSFVIVESVFAIVLGVTMIRRSRCLYRWEYWRFTLLFNIPLLPHYLSQVVLSSCDRIMIGSLCSSADVGIYSIAYSSGMVMIVLTNALNSTVVPWLYRTLELKEFDRIRKTCSLLSAVIGLSVIAVDALAPEIVSILAPSEYKEAMNLVPTIAASLMFIFIYSYCSNIEFYYEKRSYATIASVSSAIINIVLNASLIPSYGYQMASYTTLICYIVLALFHYLIAQYTIMKTEGIKAFNSRMIWGLALAILGLSFILQLLYPYPIVRYSIFFGFMIVVIFHRKKLARMVKEFKI